MKWFKLIDILVSIALMTFYVAKGCFSNIELLIEGYLVVGGWQCLSMVVHATCNWNVRKGNLRYVYHWISFIAVITIPMGSVWILGATAPFMAVFYTGLCTVEWTALRQSLKLRRLVHLK